VGILRDSDDDELLMHGSELKLMSVKEIDDLLTNNKYKVIVFARLTPQQKLSIVDSCQRVGKILNARDFKSGDDNNDEANQIQSSIPSNQLSFFIFR
jgi:magnesium-transporting ATPase (P-type)